MYSDTSSSSSSSELSSDSNQLIKRYHYYSMRYQTLLDRLNGQPMVRWGVFAFLFVLYLFRVFYWGGWYIVTYALGIYYLNLLIAFLSPQVDPELENDFDSYESSDALPNVSVGRNFSKRTSGSEDEFRPFVRRLPEFKFWYAVTKALVIALFFTSSRAFDIPVYYPILLGYFIILFVLTMRKQIQHMIKYKYVPFTVGKRSYKPSATGPTPLYAATSMSAPSAPVTSLGYSPAVGFSSAFQPPKPGFQPTVSANPSYHTGFQPTVTPLSHPAAAATSAATTISPPPTTLGFQSTLSSPPTADFTTVRPTLSPPTKTGKKD